MVEISSFRRPRSPQTGTRRAGEPKFFVPEIGRICVTGQPVSNLLPNRHSNSEEPFTVVDWVQQEDATQPGFSGPDGCQPASGEIASLPAQPARAQPVPITPFVISKRLGRFDGAVCALHGRSSLYASWSDHYCVLVSSRLKARIPKEVRRTMRVFESILLSTRALELRPVSGEITALLETLTAADQIIRDSRRYQEAEIDAAIEAAADLDTALWDLRKEFSKTALRELAEAYCPAFSWLEDRLRLSDRR